MNAISIYTIKYVELLNFMNISVSILPHRPLSSEYCVVCWSRTVLYYTQTRQLWPPLSSPSQNAMAKMADTEETTKMNDICWQYTIIFKYGPIAKLLMMYSWLTIFQSIFFHSLIWAEFESIHLVSWFQHTAVWLLMYSAACIEV